MSDLQTTYWGSFVLCGFVCFALQAYSRTSETKVDLSTNPNNAKFTSFQRNYLIIFLLAMFSDWLQGPYVYELYVSYGFTHYQIAELFVGGFASSMTVGTFIGGLADKVGRKIMCVTYCVCYICACLTKMVPDYWTLMLGRFLAGVSTSLLFSVFESWMICEHHKQGFDASLLSDTFAYATFGNGLVAVIAGLIANSVADSFGYIAPFLVAILPLTVVAVLICFTWNENYGSNQASSGLMSSLSKGFELIRSDSRILALGLGQSLFEGAMYTFIFMFTPALKSSAEKTAEKLAETIAVSTVSASSHNSHHSHNHHHGQHQQHGQHANNGHSTASDEVETTSQYLGLIFAVFMVCVMVGSSVFKIFSAKKETLYKIPLYMHSIAFASMLVTAVFLENKTVVYTSFLVFECTLGLFYPSYGVIKSEKIPEDIRSAVMNIFRIPLNAFVVVLLLNIKYLSSREVFYVCTATHGLAFLCYLYFYSYSRVTANETNSSDVYVVKSDEELEQLL